MRAGFRCFQVINFYLSFITHTHTHTPRFIGGKNPQIVVQLYNWSTSDKNRIEISALLLHTLF